MSLIKECDKKKLGNKSSNTPPNKSSPEQKQEVPKMEITDLSSEDAEEALKLINDIPAITSAVSDVIQNVTKRIENGELQTEKGLSFLDLKNFNMLNYITNLSYIILRKLNGKKIENDPAVKHLAELRVVMEKMRPIEDKLKYQISKLLASTSSENIDTNDPLKFRANPDSLIGQEEGEEDSDEEKQKETKIYLPPKISAAYYDEGNVLERKKKALEHAQKRALSSRMLNELRQEYDTGPEEIKETVHEQRRELQEIERFEEDVFTRVSLTKKQKHDMRQVSTVTNFDTGFDDLSSFDRIPNSMPLKKKSKWKGKFKNKNKKKGVKRKR